MAQRYMRISDPEIQHNPNDYFGRLSSLTSPPHDLHLHSVTSPDYDIGDDQQRGISLKQTSYSSTLQSPEPIAPHRDDLEEYGRSDRRASRKSSHKSAHTLRHYSSSLLSKARESVSSLTVPGIASPWEHGRIKDPDTAPLIPHTARKYDHRVQRRRLFINSAFQLCITCMLCAGMAGTLLGYHSIWAMTTQQKHTFNAVITFLSICLGINLASSFRSYAQMMRWRLLASKYRTLQEFDLVMQCESQMKVLRLLWTGRTRGYYFLNLTQLLCLAWILLNITLQVLVAMVGLTYSLDQSQVKLRTQPGTISIVDLSAIYTWNSDVTTLTWYEQQFVANLYAMEGSDYNVLINENYPDEPDSEQQQAIYTNTDETQVQCFFGVKNADFAETSIVESTSRQVQSSASCTEYKVTSQPDENTKYVTYVDDSGEHKQFLVNEWSPGVITYASNNRSDCGERCTNMVAYQAAGANGVVNPHFFICKSSVGKVTGIPEDVDDPQLYELPAAQAQILAGALGWSGFWYEDTPYQWNMYSANTLWSPAYEVGEGVIKDLLMQSSMYAVAAMEANGPRVNTTGFAPTWALNVDVEWEWSWLLLGAIPLVQALALICVISWANKAIIKDDSLLGNAKLLMPIVAKLGQRGCLLTGKEIAAELSNIRVAYGYRTPEGASERDRNLVRHVDVLEQHEGYPLQRSMPPGLYDGDPVSTAESPNEPRSDDDRFLGLNRRCELKRRTSV